MKTALKRVANNSDPHREPSLIVLKPQFQLLRHSRVKVFPLNADSFNQAVIIDPAHFLLIKILIYLFR
jgi:hypothetical protein